MTDFLLSGLLAQKLPEHFPDARFSEICVSGFVLEHDQWGMPLIEPKADTKAQFVRISRLGADDLARIDKLVAAYGLAVVEIMVEARPINALISTNDAAKLEGDAPFVLDAVLNAPSLALAKAAVIGARYRAQAVRLAAMDRRQMALTHQGRETDIEGLRKTPLSTGFYDYERFEYCHRRFDGKISTPISRDVLISGDAAIVLPVDFRMNKLVLIEQMRPAALARGSWDAWGVEAVAGLIGENESAEWTARRELEEEAGLVANALYEIAPCYQSPGTVSQFMYLFFADVDLSAYQAGVFGLDEEGEDIRTHIVDIDEAIGFLKTGEINNAPLQILLYALALEREQISHSLLAGNTKAV